MERESIGYIKNQEEAGNDRGIIFVLRENGDEKLVHEISEWEYENPKLKKVLVSRILNSRRIFFYSSNANTHKKRR